MKRAPLSALLPLLPLLLASGPPGVIAQDAAPRQDSAVLSGRLLVSGLPADTGTVVLHRVTPEVSGPIDSVRVGPGGGFHFVLGSLDAPGLGEVLFASHRFDGFLYFGPPIGEAGQLDAPYEVEAFPARQVPPEGIELPLAVRNLFVEEGPEGWRVTDLFEIGNDSAHTWVPAGPDAVVWRIPLPPTAFAVRVAEGDTGPGTVVFEDGELRVRSAIPPAGRLVVVQYDLPGIEATIPLPGRTGAFELLVREPAPSLRVRGLVSEPAIELEPGSVYRRWRGADLDGEPIRIEIGEEPVISPAWGAILLALVLAGVGGWLVFRGRRKGAVVEDGGDRRALLLEIARLDEGEARGAADRSGSAAGDPASAPPEAVDPEAAAEARRTRRALLLQRLEELDRRKGSR